MNRTIEWLVRACAVAGGCVVVAITLVTTVSIVGRWLFNSPLLGDTEVVEYGMAIVVASYLPICMWRGANIIVDFFTARASEATQRGLDRFGALLLALVMGLMTWRTGVGGLNAWTSQTGSMIMGFPEWIVYVGMLPPLALTALIALVQAVRGFDDRQVTA